MVFQRIRFGSNDPNFSSHPIEDKCGFGLIDPILLTLVTSVILEFGFDESRHGVFFPHGISFVLTNPNFSLDPIEDKHGYRSVNPNLYIYVREGRHRFCLAPPNLLTSICVSVDLCH